ncbi:MAG: macro domain-containing protein [Nitrospiraceae bacterium]|nr:macro domain-containing protein [Nitrospiraceae bacterium]
MADIEVWVESAVMRLVRGDITGRYVDAIVNAADAHLQHGGGVAGAIVRKGGEIIQQESDRIGYTPVGSAVITSAGFLPARYVIHAVGPRMGEGDEDRKLKSAVVSILELASQKGLQSISMPAISSGIFGFPRDRCAEILVLETAAYLKAHPSGSLKIVEFCIFDEATMDHFRKEFAALARGQEAT